jgi:hypothetical protein
MFAPKQNPLDSRIAIYRSFLDDYLKGNESEKERFVNILNAAYYYGAEKIDIRKIDNTQFDIINYLLTNYGHEIKSLDINNLQKADFVWLRNVFDDYFNHDDESLLGEVVANMSELKINTILHTKDGGKIGNAIITGKIDKTWAVKTDYGNVVFLTTDEIGSLFNIAWYNSSKEVEGYTCQEKQEIMANNHKHRVEQ